MPSESVVVVGGGQAGFQTCAALRDNGFAGSVTLVCGERALPYQRPPLSKAFLHGDADVELRPESYYFDQRVSLVHASATRIDRARREVVLDSGGHLPYTSLVLAIGARPRPLPLPGALALRTHSDAVVLRDRLPRIHRLVVVGGGFIGLEVAAAARKQGIETVVVESLPRTMARVVTPEMAARLTAEHVAHGTSVLCGRLAISCSGRKVVLDNGDTLEADLVLVGIGVVPNVELAVSAGLAVDDGVVVDEHLRTISDEAIYAIGDCANFPTRLGRVRLESVQNAVDQANCVAAAICGNPKAYDAVPWFWSDQHGIKLQIAGLSTGYDQAVVSGDVEAGRFSVFCFRQGRLVAVESANKPADHVLSRRLLAGRPDLTPAEVAAPGFSLKSRTS